MPPTENQSVAFDRMPVPGCRFSREFLNQLGAPEFTCELSFSVEATGLLRCKASYHVYDDLVKGEDIIPTATKEWEVQLPRQSTFYRLITGETT